MADSDEHEAEDRCGGYRDMRRWFDAQFPIGYGNTPLTQLQCLLPLAGFVRVRVEHVEPHDVYVLRFGCDDNWTVDKVTTHLIGIFSRLGYRVSRKKLLVWLDRRRVKAVV